MARGRKKRRNIRKLVARNPAMLAHTMRRLILLTGGSGVLSTTAPAGRAAAFGIPLATVAVGVLEALAAPGATRAAGGVPAGVSFAGGAGRGAGFGGGI